jgi:hypothetical protein
VLAIADSAPAADLVPATSSVRQEIIPRTSIPRCVMDSGTRSETAARLHISAAEEAPETSEGLTSQHITARRRAAVGTALVLHEARPLGRFTAEPLSPVHILQARLSATHLSPVRMPVSLRSDPFRALDSDRRVCMAGPTEAWPGMEAAGEAMVTGMVTATAMVMDMDTAMVTATVTRITAMAIGQPMVGAVAFTLEPASGASASDGPTGDRGGRTVGTHGTAPTTMRRLITITRRTQTLGITANHLTVPMLHMERARRQATQLRLTPILKPCTLISMTEPE